MHVCLALMLFSGTPLVSATPKDCLKWTAYEVALEEGVEPYLFLAIIEHESKWRISAYNKRTRDYGLGQVNERNVRALGLDRSRLLSDPIYNMRVSAQLLKAIERRYGHEPQWFARYNVGYGHLGPNRAALAHKYVTKVLKQGRTVAALN